MPPTINLCFLGGPCRAHDSEQFPSGGNLTAGLPFLWDCKLLQGRERALLIVYSRDGAGCSMEKCFLSDVMYDSNIFLIKFQQ